MAHRTRTEDPRRVDASGKRNGPIPKDPSVLFWAKVDKTKGCWLWTAAKTWNGYGVFRLSPSSSGQRRMAYAHRWAYEHLVGPIPNGLTLDHLCMERACVNPAHLEPITNAENNRRGNSLSARNARKTHCVNGHEFTDQNTYRRPDGDRDCRTCRSEAVRRQRT